MAHAAALCAQAGSDELSAWLLTSAGITSVSEIEAMRNAPIRELDVDYLAHHFANPEVAKRLPGDALKGGDCQ